MKKQFLKLANNIAAKFSISIALCLLTIKSAFAICPVCTLVVGAGIGLSRWLKIDDSITGLWIGAFTVSLIGWTIDYLNKKGIRFIGRKPLIVLGYYFIIIVPLYWMKIIGQPFNKIWGYDKLVVGTAIGSVAFLFSTITYFVMKKKHGGHAYFPGQKVVMPFAVLLILSFVLYWLVK